MTFMQQALRRGHHAATWTIGQSALIFPYLAGVALWSDPIAARKTAGVGLILVSLGALGLAKRRAGDNAPAARRDYLWLTLAVLTMLGLGTHQALSTWPSHWAGWSDAARLRVPLLATGATVGYVAASVAMRRWPGRLELLLGALLAAQAVPGQWLLYKAMDHLSPYGMTGLAYPLAVGTCILCFVAYSLLVLKEKLTAFHVAGLALGVAGIGLMAW
jgi:multidrug transporter EmrE-like cation transporter